MAKVQTNSQGEEIDGRKPSESEKPVPMVNRPTVGPAPKDEDVKKAEAEAKKADELKAKEEAEADKDAKKGARYFFKNSTHAGLTVQVQKVTQDRDGKDVQSVDEQATFEQYYDTWKGDTVRVGFLATSSPKVAKACRENDTCEEIDEKEYKQALEGDDKHEKLNKAPVPAV